ncbi:MAG: hypothetical protein HGB21_14400, partial [Nitrospirae bacterium]|nr:hypothetical protein [Nitrospirota bacterium]
MDTRETTLWRAKQMNVQDRIKILDYDIQTKDYFITVSKQSQAVGDKRVFLDKVDQCLRAAKKDGRYLELV